VSEAAPPAQPGPSAQPAAHALIPDGLDATLVLVRHGETEWIRENRFQGQGETPLSATGRRQAALVGERLAHAHEAPPLPVPGGLPIEIVHSPLGRTAETAQAVAGAMGRAAGPDARLPVVRPDPGLLEIGQGEWQGVPQDEIARRWPRELSAWRHTPWDSVAPGGETVQEVQARVRPALAAILERLGRDYPRGSINRPQVSGYAGVSPQADQPWSVLVGHDGVFKVVMLTLFDLPLTKFWMFTMGLTGITVVELRGGRPVVWAANLTDHLAPLHDEDAQARAEERSRRGTL
jgi:probable phosphoglycerate mutase